MGNFSDETITLICLLSVYEDMRGNIEVAKLHATGLDEIITLRGGLRTIDRICRAKVMCANLLPCADRLDVPMLCRPIPLSANNTSTDEEDLALPAPVGPLEVMSQGNIHVMLTSIIEITRKISSDRHAAQNENITFDMLLYYERVMCLTRNLLSIKGLDGFEELLRLCMISYLQPMYRHCAFEPQNSYIRAEKLREAFGKSDMAAHDPIASLWAVFVAFMVSRNTPDDSYFREMLLYTLDRAQIPRCGAWSNLRDYLQRFLWTDFAHEDHGKFLYEKLYITL